MYTVKFTRTAEKEFYKLDRLVQQRIIAALDRCKVRPHAHVKKLVGNPYFSLRVGDFRVILDIKDGQLLIMVIELGHRRNIYQR